MTNSNTANHGASELQAITRRLSQDASYTYTVEDAKKDMGLLLVRLEALEEREAVVAHLIKLAISHGVSSAASDRLQDALDELGPPSSEDAGNDDHRLVAHWSTERSCDTPAHVDHAVA